MASIVHKADGRICVKSNQDGKWVWKHLGRGPSAQLLAERLKYDLDQAEACPAPPSITFDELTAMYLQSRVHMAAKNLDKLIYRFKSVISPLLGQVPASKIDHAILNRYINQRQQQTRQTVNKRTGGKNTYQPPTMSTIQNELAVIMVVLNWAAYRNQPPILSDNPARGFNKGERVTASIQPPTTAEIDAIIKHAAPHLVRALVLDVFTGARPGESELFALQWSHVDFAGGKLTVISAKKGGIKSRDIPISKSLREHLMAWRQEDLKDRAKYLIHYRGNPVGSVKTAWAAAKRRAGVTRKLRLYDCRHQFCTRLLEAGADIKAVSELAGHKNPEITRLIYQHVATQMKVAAIDLLPDIVLGTTGTTDTTTNVKPVKNIKQKHDVK